MTNSDRWIGIYNGTLQRVVPSQPRSGGRDLTASGAYPYQFGHRVARLHTEFMMFRKDYGATADLTAVLDQGFQDQVSVGHVQSWDH